MARIDRRGRKADTFEKRHGIPQGPVKNKDGRDTREDKRTGTIKKEKD